MSNSAPISLLHLPPEIIAIIALELPIESLRSFHRTSRAFYHYIFPSLYKAAYQRINAIPALCVGLALRSEPILRIMLQSTYKITLFDTEDNLLHTTPHPPSPETLSTILSHGPNVIIQNNGYFATPLERAVRGVKPNIVKLLLEGGAIVNVRNKDRYEPLHYASGQDGSASTVLHLLSYGADPERPDGRGRTSLHLAIMNFRSDVVKILLEKGACITCGGKGWEDAQKIYGNSFNGQQNLRRIYSEFLQRLGDEYRDEHGKGLLHIALAWRFCDSGLLGLIINNGCSVTLEDNEGRSPLHDCVRILGRRFLVRRLVAVGAGVNAMDKEGLTPLDWLMELWRRRVDLFMANGTYLSHLGYREGEEAWLNMVECLVEEGASVRGRDMSFLRSRIPPNNFLSGILDGIFNAIAVRDGKRDYRKSYWGGNVACILWDRLVNSGWSIR